MNENRGGKKTIINPSSPALLISLHSPPQLPLSPISNDVQ